MTIQLLIADDHAVVRRGLQMFLSLDDAFEIVGEAVNGQEAIDMAQSLKPDVILMDLLMPVLSGIDAIPIIRKTVPEAKIIALTSVLDNGAVVGAIQAGAIGYLLKDTQSDELIHSIKWAATGQVQVAPQAVAMLVPDGLAALTEREVDVLRLIAQGYSNREIADHLVLGEKTIKTHVSNMLSKLQLSSRTQAALYAIRIGLVNAKDG